MSAGIVVRMQERVSDVGLELSHQTIRQMWAAELRTSAAQRAAHAMSSPVGREELFQAFRRGVRASEAVMRSMKKGGAR